MKKIISLLLVFVIAINTFSQTATVDGDDATNIIKNQQSFQDRIMQFKEQIGDATWWTTNIPRIREIANSLDRMVCLMDDFNFYKNAASARNINTCVWDAEYKYIDIQMSSSLLLLSSLLSNAISGRDSESKVSDLNSAIQTYSSAERGLAQLVGKMQARYLYSKVEENKIQQNNAKITASYVMFGVKPKEKISTDSE